MFFKVLTKTALLGGAGGAGGAVYLTNSINTDSGLISSQQKIKETSLPQRISSLEDIAIYEEFYGCKFAFINRWKENEIYDANGFLEKYKNEKGWESSVITGDNLIKDKCKTQKIVTLSFVNKVARYYVQ